MDRALYVAANAATLALRAQAANSNNLANATTTGFRAEMVASEAMPLSDARQYSRVHEAGFSAADGAIQHTGNPLHVAMQGDHYLEVLGPDGEAAYTRAGDLRLNANGQLLNGAGHPVMGVNGPIALPPHQSAAIGSDGTISIVPEGSAGGTLVQIGRLRVMEIAPQDLQRGADGLLRLAEDAVANPAVGDALQTGAVEGANVNTAESLVKMIELARQFELNVNLMRSVDENAAAGSRLLRRG
ncbi:MAG: flagellar basal body rod protein FlgF [Algiphilus sp.]|uniref:flagellar basal body rod protein FlgF n=1 Tax=Algiphilus sp. TaxID=1872431 RepID=UPI001CA72016|nr:flagellar basal body rod protein FlgF [Algiphilus sp.]MBY8967005.1 flagellar basal body rod protein FlgF [Algiphilus acroporae]MCI5063529.1 flagellar basal body rod protein FlgF [Algiphilus sp.]MCI5102303.1 flagellar basal body rod protein FlgF [Algiphilus sp.]